MKKILALILMLFAFAARPATIWIALTNWDATLTTNSIRISPVAQSPTLDGQYAVIGLPKLYTTTNGLYTNTVLAGNYKLEILGVVFPQPIYFQVGTNANQFNNVLDPGVLISGGNFFVTGIGTNSTFITNLNVTYLTNVVAYVTNLYAVTEYVTNLNVTYLTNETSYITNLFSTYITNNTFITTNLTIELGGGATNLNLTPNSIMQSDANDAEASVPNGTGVLTNNGAGDFGWLPFTSSGLTQLWGTNASNGSITNLNGGGVIVGSDGTITNTGMTVGGTAAGALVVNSGTGTGGITNAGGTFFNGIGDGTYFYVDTAGNPSWTGVASGNGAGLTNVPGVWTNYQGFIFPAGQLYSTNTFSVTATNGFVNLGEATSLEPSAITMFNGVWNAHSSNDTVNFFNLDQISDASRNFYENNFTWTASFVDGGDAGHALQWYSQTTNHSSTFNLQTTTDPNSVASVLSYTTDSGTQFTINNKGLVTANGFTDNSGTPGSLVAYQGGGRLGATNISGFLPAQVWTEVSGLAYVTDGGVVSNASLEFQTNQNNTILGLNALANVPSSSLNIAVGPYALNQLDNSNGGNHNTAVGYHALEHNHAPYEDTALGEYAGSALISTPIAGNTFIGALSAYLMLEGDANTVVGAEAVNGSSGKTNHDLAILGYQAAGALRSVNGTTAIGSKSLAANTTGIENTAVGFNSGATLTTGSSNLFLGFMADTSLNSIQNAVAIGNRASVSANNDFVLGNANSNLKVSGSTRFLGSNYFSGAVTTSTNQNQIKPDFSVAEQLISTNAAFTFLAPVGVDTTLKTVQWTLVNVTNTTAAAVLITSPANCHTVGTAYVTNLTAVWFQCYASKFTNAYYVPVF